MSYEFYSDESGQNSAEYLPEFSRASSEVDDSPCWCCKVNKFLLGRGLLSRSGLPHRSSLLSQSGLPHRSRMLSRSGLPHRSSLLHRSRLLSRSIQVSFGTLNWMNRRAERVSEAEETFIISATVSTVVSYLLLFADISCCKKEERETGGEMSEMFCWWIRFTGLEIVFRTFHYQFSSLRSHLLPLFTSGIIECSWEIFKRWHSNVF